MVKINRPVASPVVEQDISLMLGSAIPSGDLSWIIPIVVGGVQPGAIAPAEGEKKALPPSAIHAAGVKVMLVLLEDGPQGTVMTVNVYSAESAGAVITADSSQPQNLLGSFQVPLDAVLSNVNVPRP